MNRGPKIESKRSGDALLLITTLALVALGVAMVYSASSIVAQEKFGDGYYFLKRQALYAGLGLLLMLLLMRMNYQWLRRLALPGLLISLVLLAALFVPSLGVDIGGARRWLKIAGLSLQPSEVAKVGLVLYLAHSLARKGEEVRHFFFGYLPPLTVSVFVAGLVFVQPDFGNAALLFLMAAILLFLGGARLSHLALTGVAALPAVYFLIETAAYRHNRVMAFLDPWKDPMKSGFQIVQSYLAIGSGGLSGLGLGNGRQKLFYLPEAHTDFILSVIGEELGLLGMMVVLLAFAILVVRGFCIALKSPDIFGYYLGLGLTFLLGFQAAVNMGVVTGLLPTKGLTLPFISFGGSSLVLNMVAVGLLLSISSRRQLGQA